MTHEPDPEAPEADLAEQHTPAAPGLSGQGDDDDLVSPASPIPSVEIPSDANPADVLEQAQEVPYDDDEER